MKKYLGLLLILLWLGCTLGQPTETIDSTSLGSDQEESADNGSDEAIQQSSRTPQKMRTLWQQMQPLHTGDHWITEPSISSPYSLGELHPQYLQDSLNMANYCRYLAGLPYDLELDTQLCSQAQHGAVLLAAHGSLTHHPTKPSDMPQDFFDTGYASTTSSNIAWNYSYLHRSIKEGYMSDNDSYNLYAVGHRRWILNPALKKVGFGHADDYLTMQVFDSSRSETVEYDSILWPARGYFPKDFLAGSDPWSITLNPSLYSPPEAAEISVVLTNLTTGETFFFDSSDDDTDHEYFSVNNQGFGVNNCIVFRPDPYLQPHGFRVYTPGDRYRVTLQGIKDVAGESAEMIYEVEFFEL